MGSSEIQGRLWGAAARDWAELFEPMSKPIWIAMLDSVNVQAGMRFLDLGCGGGGSSVLAHERGAQVAGLDAAGELISIARDRLPDGDFRVGDLEILPYEDNEFDVVFASMAIMFAADPAAALDDMKRVAKPNGQITLGVWGNPEDCEYRHVLHAVATAMSAPSTGKGPFYLSRAGELEELLDDADLKLIDSGEADVPFRFENDESMWRAVSSAGPFQSALKTVGEELLRSAVVDASRPFELSNGEILFNNRFRYVTAAT